MLYLWVAGSSKVTRVGRVPTFCFSGAFLRPSELNSWRASATAAERVARSYGLEIFDVQLRREAVGTVLAGRSIDRTRAVGHPLRRLRQRGDEARLEENGRHRGLPARQPGPERAARRRGRRLETAGARHRVHPRSLVAGARSAAAARGGLPAIRGTAGQSGDEPSRSNGQSAFAGRLAGVEDGQVLLEEGRTDAPRAARADQAGAAGGGILSPDWRSTGS